MDSLAEDEQVEVLQAIAHFSRTGIAMELSYYANEVFVNYILPTLMKRRKAAESRPVAPRLGQGAHGVHDHRAQ